MGLEPIAMQGDQETIMKAITDIRMHIVNGPDPLDAHD